ncbi:MAG TPA: glycosyltransferase family 39 protein [Solirubrobacteraceae bacterium]|nr:glycosyltransferase family 39 protein [Solirubrobacteraceae bacterium]
MSARTRTAEWVAVALVTLGAGALRLVHIGQVPPDPFYDAAVRSMELSWHNLFFGVYDPGGSLSIDKPPVDLWLQVASVELLGFSSTTLKLPEALAGVLSVPLLYVVVRRIWSGPAGVAAAVAMAVLPISVITSRSDTMDGVMMLVLVLALWAIVQAVQSGRRGWLLLGAGALGVAFDVKLLESLVALPGLAVFAYLGMRGSRPRRALRLAAAGVVYVAVALSWLTATLLFPAHDRPYAIGSTDGSAWNAAFVFNGTDRLGGKTAEPGQTVYEAGHRYPVATQEQRDHIPIVPPSPTRLLATVGPLSGERLGLEIVVGLLLGVPALLWGLRGEPLAPDPRRGRGRAAGASGDPGGTPARPSAAGDDALEQRLRMRRAAAGGLIVWMLAGIVLYSHMIRLHPRYVEAFTPAVAMMLGIGVAWAATPLADLADLAARTLAAAHGGAPAGVGARGRSGGARVPARAWERARLALLLVTLAVVVCFGERLMYGTPAAWWISLLAALGAAACALGARRPGAGGRARRLLAPAGVIALTLVATLAIPLQADRTAIADRVSDAGLVGQLPGAQQHPLSAFLRTHQHGAYYEVAAESATAVGSLIVQDARPILVLTSYDARVFTSVAQLERLIAAGKVRYAFLNTFCAGRARSVNPACSGPVRWVRAHGSDVSRQAGLGQGGLLYLLPGAKR